MARFAPLALLTGALALAACDDGGGSPKTKAVEDPGTVMAGQATGQQSVALTEIQPEAGSAGAGGQFNRVGSAMQGFVGQYQSFKAQQQAGVSQLTAGLAVLEQAQAVEDSFTYDNGHLVATVNYDNAGTALHYNVDLQIDAVETGGFGVDGTFRLDFASSQGMYDVDYALDATYAGFQLDGAGCPIGGSITVDYSIDVGGAFLDSLPPETRAQIADSVAASGRVVASYGPTCGEVAVEGT